MANLVAVFDLAPLAGPGDYHVLSGSVLAHAGSHTFSAIGLKRVFIRAAIRIRGGVPARFLESVLRLEYSRLFQASDGSGRSSFVAVTPN